MAVENAWMEYNHNRYLSVRVGKQLSPQYWWQHRYPNLTYSTSPPIYLRELFPPELVGAMVRGQVSRPVGNSEFGVGYSLYAANNNFEGNARPIFGMARPGAAAFRFDSRRQASCVASMSPAISIAAKRASLPRSFTRTTSPASRASSRSRDCF